jgi:Kef-type K+ transport system membrane component KefB
VQPGFPLQDPILQFTVLIAAALVMQLTFERARLPGLIGLIAFGAVLGPGGIGFLPQAPIIAFLGQVGLVYVMFIAGLEIDLDLIAEHRNEAILFGLLAFAASALPMTLAALLLGFGPVAAILLGALIASHTLLAYPVLLQHGLIRRLPVVTAIGGTLLTDTLALLVLAVIVSAHHAGGVAVALLPLALLAALTAAALRAVPWLSRRIFAAPTVSRPQRALFALAVLLVLAAGAELIGTDEIIGAFLAGIVLNRPLGQRPELREHIEFVGRMLFIPFFFIWTGTLVDFAVFAGQPNVWLLAALLFGAVLFGKTLASWLVGARYDYAPKDRALMTVITLPQAAATLAITITGQQLGILDEAVVDAVIIVIVATCLLGPVLSSRIGQRIAAEEAAGRVEREEHAADEPMR